MRDREAGRSFFFTHCDSLASFHVLARKHLSERSLRYQNDALQLLRNIVLRIRRNLTRASILKSSSREIGKALLKRDLFSKPQTDPSDDGLAVPRTVPEPNENALDATSRLLGDFVEHGEAALVADDDNENGPFSKVYGGRCLIYVPHSFQESQLSLVSEYTSRGMAKMAGTELDTRSQAVAEALSSSRCLILLSPRDTDIIRKAFSPAGTEDGDQQEDHKMFFRQPERCVDDIKATLLIRFHLSNGEESTAAAAADGTPRSSRDFLSPHDSPGDTTSVSRNPISSGDKTGTSHTSEGMEGGADWGLIVLQIQDPGLDRDELLERVEFAASLLTDAAEQIGIALNQASSIELDRLRVSWFFKRSKASHVLTPHSIDGKLETAKRPASRSSPRDRSCTGP